MKLNTIFAAFALALYGDAVFSQQANLLTDPSFEQRIWVSNGNPSVFDTWFGDLVHFVGVNQGIVPHDGTTMVRHIATGVGGPGGGASDLEQYVDMRPYGTQIDQGLASVHLSVWVNRVAGGPTTDTEWYLNMNAYDSGLFSGARLGKELRRFQTDSDPTTWEELESELQLPQGTRLVEIDIAAVENVLNNSTLPEFDGHYTDDAVAWIEIRCYADCDQSTSPGILDVFDFLCFQNSFVSGEPYACDCDTSTGSGVCDIFDFLCFQNAFVGGCP